MAAERKTSIPCPYCERPNSVVRGSVTTRTGSFHVCWGCLRVGIFADTQGQMEIQRLTPEQLEVFACQHPGLYRDTVEARTQERSSDKSWLT